MQSEAVVRANAVRNEILNAYYRDTYKQVLFSGGAQGAGTWLFEKSLEAHWRDRSPSRTLELGAGSGEHLPFVLNIPKNEYVALDLHPNRAGSIPEVSEEMSEVLNLVEGDAHSIPFPNDYFDRVSSTCLMHHVHEPLAVFYEMRRVVRPGGEIAVVLPTDPGLLNQMVKRLVTYRRIRSSTANRPQLIYAMEHPNHVGALVELAKHVFASDKVRFRYRPFFLPSWNSNLWINLHVEIAK